MILSKLSEEELAQIVDEHMKLSNALGFAVGIHANSDDNNIEKKSCVYDESEVIMALYQVNCKSLNIVGRWCQNEPEHYQKSE